MTNDTTNAAPVALPSLPFRVTAIAGRSSTHVKFAPNAATRKVIAAALNLLDLPQMIFEGDIKPSGKRDMVLRGTLKALAIQPCSVTLEPVKTRIDELVLRQYIADFDESTADEVEIPEDDTLEPLGEIIDGAAVAIEALSLALPLYPRAPGVESGEMVFAPPDIEPLLAADLKPFAGLAKLIVKAAEQNGED